MKTYILPLLLLVGCGNPHLNKLDSLMDRNLPIIGTPVELTKKGIGTDEGLNLKTEHKSISGLVKLQNLDTDKVWSMSFEFEKGENFRFKNLEFPGTNGTCEVTLDMAKDCVLEIEFFSEHTGLFADNLRITYSSVDDPKDVRMHSYPLRGERVSKAQEAVSKVSIKTIANEDRLDLGKSDVATKVHGTLVVTNEGPVDVLMKVKLESNEALKLTGNGTCGDELLAKESCFLEVELTSKVLGIHQDRVLLTHTPVSLGKEVTISFPVFGEKIKHQQQGPLVLSEVFSNTLDFGNVTLGAEVKRQFEIQNLGETVYTLKDHQLKSDVFKFSGGKYPGLNGTCGDVIRPGSCIVELSYRPREEKEDLGTFGLRTNEGDSVELKLKGKGVRSKTCEASHEYLIVPEKSFPARDVVFPYLLSHPSTSASLRTLYGLQVNGYVKETDNYVVTNGMVYTTFRIPKMEGKVAAMNFGVHVLKIILDSYKDTESLCLSSKNVRKCSGHEFSLDSWKKLKNPAFWDKYKTPVSERYERQFASGERKCGSFNCMDLNTQYELSDIFELSTEEMEQVRKDGVFTLVFADDTRMLKMPRIAVKTKMEVSCE